MYYAAQVGRRPPRFAVQVNDRRLISRDWQEVGAFLGPNIEDFYARHPLPALVALWEAAGFERVQVRRMSFGAGVVMSAVRSS